jgi:hypothetical protein
MTHIKKKYRLIVGVEGHPMTDLFEVRLPCFPAVLSQVVGN